MDKRFSIVILLSVSLSATSQNKRVYYDERWQETKKRKAEWVRFYSQQDSIYKIEDHYIDGPMYMTGYRTSIESNSCSNRVGPIIFYDHEGHKMREGQYNKGIRTGTWKYYYKNSDDLHYEYHYTGDTERLDYTLTFDSLTHKLIHRSVNLTPKKTADWEYSANDSVYYETNSSNNGDTQITTIKYTDHIITRKEVMKGRESKTGGNDIHYNQSDIVKCYNEKGEEIKCDNTNKIYTYVEQMPKAYKMSDYLSHTMHYPKQAVADNVQGKVIVRFSIDEDGAVANPHVVRGIGSGCDEEALRVIAEMPYWQPGLQNGVPVRVVFTLPLTFKLQ